MPWRGGFPVQRVFPWTDGRRQKGTKVNEFTQKQSRGVLPNVTSCISKAYLKGNDQQNFKSTRGPFLQKPFVKLRPAYSVSCLETPSFERYKKNYIIRNAPEKFRDFQETAPDHFLLLPCTDLTGNLKPHRNPKTSFLLHWRKLKGFKNGVKVFSYLVIVHTT